MQANLSHEQTRLRQLGALSSLPRSDGELGNGTAGQSGSTPVIVSYLKNLNTVTAGSHHTCATTTPPRKGPYAASCWGWNHYGQLGDGGTIDRDVPGTVYFF